MAVPATPHVPVPTARIAVVVHSGFGHTRVLADAVAAGVQRVPGATAQIVPVDEVATSWSVLDAAEAIVFGSPTYFAGVSAPFKAFMDATTERWAKQAWKGKLAAAFTNSAGLSGDKLGALQSIALFAAQHSMVWVSLGLMPSGTSSTGPADGLNRLGSFLGSMAQSSTDLGPDRAPPPADRRTAEALGERVARLAIGWRSEPDDGARDADRRAIDATLRDYFDGLHHSDPERLGRAFHAHASYVNATEKPVKAIDLDEYLAIVSKRQSPAARSETRTDRVLSIDFAGDSAALARVQCSIASKRFSDLLTLVRDQDGWRIIAKVFHFDLQPA